MRENHNPLWEAWLEKAAASLRAHPDYDRVRQELLGHLEDRAEGLGRSFPGLSREETEKLALEGMGEAAALSRPLAQAHSQALGVLYDLTGLLLALAAPLVALEGLFMLWRWILPLVF